MNIDEMNRKRMQEEEDYKNKVKHIRDMALDNMEKILFNYHEGYMCEEKDMLMLKRSLEIFTNVADIPDEI